MFLSPRSHGNRHDPDLQEAAELGVDHRRPHARAGQNHCPTAVHLPASGADARRSSGQGRHRGIGHPHPGRHHPGCRRGRHRLRHARSPDPMGYRRSRRARPHRPAEVHRAIDSAVGRSSQHQDRPDGRVPHRRAGAVRRCRPGGRQRPFELLAPPARFAGERQPLPGSDADETGRIWLFLHSGSRGVGNRIAQHHIDVAKKLAKQWWIELPDPDLAYLVEGTPEFDTYIRELDWAQHFAALNRDEMMDRMIAQLQRWMGEEVVVDANINCHHNYSAIEEHFGKRVWVSRKGAIHAGVGVPGLIPGSMGTASYVVEGLGNRLALNSSPHGAGRAYSRTKARKTFTGADLRAAMIGIEYRDSDAFIDEIPGAYKPIEQVMVDAGDLVSVLHELHQIVNVKGN